MSLTPPFYSGTAVATSVVFTNPGSSTPVDPTTIELRFRVGSEPVTIWTYGGAGLITRASAGNYSAVLDTTGLPGSWVVEWIGTGVCAAVGVSGFPVQPLPL